MQDQDRGPRDDDSEHAPGGGTTQPDAGGEQRKREHAAHRQRVGNAIHPLALLEKSVEHVGEGFHRFGDCHSDEHDPAGVRESPQDRDGQGGAAAKRTSRDSHRKVVGKANRPPGVGCLDGAQLQTREYEDGACHREPEREVAHLLGRGELGQHREHGPLASGIKNGARKRPAEVHSQRQRRKGCARHHPVVHCYPLTRPFFGR